MSKLAHRLAALFVSAAIVFTIGSASAATDKTSSSYSQFSHLIAQWDGIENVGRGLPHDSESTKWIDLVHKNDSSALDMTVQQLNAQFVANGLKRAANSNSGLMAIAKAQCKTYRTIEVLCDYPTSGRKVVEGGDNNHIVAFYGNKLECSGNGPLFTISGNRATFAFTYNEETFSTTSVSCYENGVSAGAGSGKDSWGDEPLQFQIGARNGGAYAFVGTIYAIRLYDTVLTAEELQANAAIDDERFFQQEIEYDKLHLGTRGGGQVRVGNGEFAASVDIELKPEVLDTTVTLEAKAAAGSRFVAWTTDLDNISSTDVLSPTISVKLRERGSMTAVFTTAEETDKDVTLYNYNGLIGMWDGLCNAGYAVAHDNATNIWKDLVSNRDLTLNDGIAFVENALQCSGKANAAAAKSNLANVKTIEVLCDFEDRKSIIGAGSGLIATWNGGIMGVGGGQEYLPTTNLATYAVVYGVEPLIYENGELLTEKTGKVTGWAGSSVVTLGYTTGYSGSYLFSKKIYAVRVYNRTLSNVELALNSDLDQWRYFGAKPSGDDRDWRLRQDGTIEYRVRVIADGNVGEVRTNDGAWGKTNVIWLAEGESLVAEARGKGVRIFNSWFDRDGAMITPHNATNQVLALTAPARAFDITALYARKTPLISVTSSDYAGFNDLIAQWDGLENVGRGLAHNSDTNVWKDLVGNRDLPLVPDRGVFTDNALDCITKSSFETATSNVTALGTSCKTVEIVLSYQSLNDNAVIIQDANFVLTAGRECFGATSGLLRQHLVNPTTIAWTKDDNFYTEGVTAPKTATSDGWNLNPYGLCLGGRYNGTHRYIGKIHAVRAYSRILTPAELALNARIDRIRYFGEKRPLISGLIFRVR